MENESKNTLRARYSGSPELEKLTENYNRAPGINRHNLDETAKIWIKKERGSSGDPFALITPVEVFEEIFPLLSR